MVALGTALGSEPGASAGSDSAVTSGERAAVGLMLATTRGDAVIMGVTVAVAGVAGDGDGDGTARGLDPGVGEGSLAAHAGESASQSPRQIARQKDVARFGMRCMHYTESAASATPAGTIGV
jgi:hypothetical protein